MTFHLRKRGKVFFKALSAMFHCSLLQAGWNFTGGVFTQRKAKSYNGFGDCSFEEYLHRVHPKYLIELYRYTSFDYGSKYNNH